MRRLATLLVIAAFSSIGFAADTKEDKAAKAAAEKEAKAQKEADKKAADAEKKDKKKVARKNDPNEIGNREVGKGVNFYSIEREIALGKGLAQEVEQIGRAHV